MGGSAMTLIMPKKPITDQEYQALSQAANAYFEGESLTEVFIDESSTWEAHGQMYADIQQMALQFQQQSLLTQDLGNGSFIHTFADAPSNAAGAIFAFDPNQYHIQTSIATADSYITLEMQKTPCGKYACPFCVEEFTHEKRNDRFVGAKTYDFKHSANDYLRSQILNLILDIYYNVLFDDLIQMYFKYFQFLRFGQFDVPIPTSKGFEIFL
jgi:hypothetical protein